MHCYSATILIAFMQVSKQLVRHPSGSGGTQKAVYEAVEFIGGLHRPMVKSADENGRLRPLTRFDVP